MIFININTNPKSERATFFMYMITYSGYLAYYTVGQDFFWCGEDSGVI